MICVSIGRGRHKHTIAEHRHMVEQGAKLVEIRLDYIRGNINLKRLMQDRPCPIIATCRRRDDGGHWEGTEEQRLMILRSAIADGVDYVDLEEDIAGLIPRFGKTKRIVSYHNFRETPEDLYEIHDRMSKLNADYVKIATMAHNPHDTLRMLRLLRDAKVPTLGMCMGDMGTPSRILAGKFGAPFTYATFHHERALAPGQLSYRQMVDIYHYDEINTETEVYGVIGDPIGHSLSPLIHNAAFRSLGMNKVYVPFRVPREDLREFMADCRELGVKGLSVTIPNKEEVIRFVTQPEESVRSIEAANTLVFNGGELAAFNTDYQAAMDSLVQAYEAEGGVEALKNKLALVLGAGGAARAIAAGLKHRGARVLIASRTLERTEELANKIGCKSTEWALRHAVKPDIIVNCTPVGMHPNVDETPIDKKIFRRTTVIFDTVYNPEQTLLIKEAREAGCRTITGVEMFIRQAAMQFKLFTGQEAPIELMRNEVKKATGAVRMHKPGEAASDKEDDK